MMVLLFLVDIDSCLLRVPHSFAEDARVDRWVILHTGFITVEDVLGGDALQLPLQVGKILADDVRRDSCPGPADVACLSHHHLLLMPLQKRSDPVSPWPIVLKSRR